MSLRTLKEDDSLKTYFRDQGKKVLVSYSNIKGMSEQDIFSRLYYIQPYYGKSVTDILEEPYYKHQSLASKYLFMNDSMMIVHEPGTGKTITQLKSMMDLLIAKAISKFVIINASPTGNIVALSVLKKLYNNYYSPNFGNVSFSVFKRKYVSDITFSGISKFSYEPNMGIVIDEAHNLLSDNEIRIPDKNVRLEDFMKTISKIKGIKLILSTATPMFGTENSLGKFRTLMLRDERETENKIPSSMVSFTKINYDHVKVSFPQNSEFMNVNGRNLGDRSFFLSNEKPYNFYLFIVKPKPMQIADFFNLNYPSDKRLADIIKKDKFQTYDKPLIIQSKPHPDKNGNVTTESAIIEAVAEIIKNTEDGTAIIYTDILAEGSLQIGKLLERYGFEKFSLKSSNKDSYSNITQKNSEEILKYKEEIAELAKKREILSEKYMETSSQKYNSLLNDYSNMIEIYGENNNMTEKFKSYIEYYEGLLKIDEKTREIIKSIDVRKEEILAKIALLRQKTTEVKAKNVPKYAFFTSAMTAEDKLAFEIFNSPENWDGKLCKALIGSRKMRDGTNAKNVTLTFLGIADWRIPGMIQAQHRGLRSNGHEELIKQRALKYKKSLEADGKIISVEDAISYIRKEGIDFRIFQCFMDFRTLTVDDINEARPYMNPESDNYDDEDLLDFMLSDENEHQAGKKIYDAAISHYQEVGAALMDLTSSAIDFRLNVPAKFRLDFAKDDTELVKFSKNPEKKDLLGQKDTELFYINDYMIELTQNIKEILIEKKIVNTDDLIDDLKKQNQNLTDEIIICAIMELAKNKKFIYNPKTHINMIVELYETEEESILYLKTVSHNGKNPHPYSCYVDKIPIVFEIEKLRKKTIIAVEDTDIPKNSNAIIKLKDLLEKSLEKNTILNMHEIKFLLQMSNYWAFSWADLDNIENRRDYIEVYVFRSKVAEPDINLLAKDLVIYSYNSSSKTWKGLKTSNFSKNGVFFTRYSSMVYLYRNFNFSKIPELYKLPDFPYSTYIDPFSSNGVVMIKGFFTPVLDEKKSVTKQLFRSKDSLPLPFEKNVLIKTYGDPRSKGNQKLKEHKKDMHIKELTKDYVVNFLDNIAENKISLYFFLYESSDSVPAGNNTTIFKIKKNEMDEMKKAMSGYPTLRFKIPYVEKHITNEARKAEIYRMIYKAPFSRNN